MKPNVISFFVTNAARKMMLAAFLSLCVSGTLSAATQPEITREQAQATINDAIKTIASIITTETSTYTPVITFISSMVAEKSATGRTDITTFAGYARLKMELGQLAIPQEARGHLIEAVDRIAASLNVIHSLDTNTRWSLPKIALWAVVAICVAVIITKYVSSRKKNGSSVLSTPKGERAAASGPAVVVGGRVIPVNSDHSLASKAQTHRSSASDSGADEAEEGEERDAAAFESAVFAQDGVDGTAPFGYTTPPKASFNAGSEAVLKGTLTAPRLELPAYSTFGSPGWQGSVQLTEEELRANREKIRLQIAEQNAADEAAAK